MTSARFEPWTTWAASECADHCATPLTTSLLNTLILVIFQILEISMDPISTVSLPSSADKDEFREKNNDELMEKEITKKVAQID